MVISCSSRNCCGTRSSIADLPGKTKTSQLAVLFSRMQCGRRRMAARGKLPLINVLPLVLVVIVVAGDEISAARGAIDACVLRAGRCDALVAQGARGHQQATAGAGDHLVRRRQVLPGMVDDRPHAFGYGLVLQMDAVDAAVDG